MKSSIKLTGNASIDMQILYNSCTNNNQICYHIKKNRYLVDYLELKTGLTNVPIVVLNYHFKENIKDIPKCICGDNRIYHSDGYRPTCGKKECINKVREESKEKTCLVKYGHKYVTQVESIKEKSKSTLLERYGVDNITKSSDIIKKRKENNLKKWGVSDPISIKEVRKSDIRGLSIIQSGLPDGYKVLESDKNYYYKLICKNGHIFEISKSSIYLKKKDKIELCNHCNDYIGSNGEQEVYNYISSIYKGYIYRSNRKLIKPFEIDIILEDIKLCIEFNGDYWHSEKIVDNKYYHLNKLNSCLSQGYRLIQIREYDWNYYKDEIKRKLFNLINNIIDENDFSFIDGKLILDLSWYDDRLIKDKILIDIIEPDLIKIGQFYQWDCGYKIYE